jgi:serine/threonine protein phosphatase PrpC
MSKAPPYHSKNIRIKTAGITDTGRRRENNEDSILVDESHSLFIVADGMGGHNAGEIASKIAVDMTSQFLIAGLHIEGQAEDAFSTAEPIKDLMEKSIQLANRKILEEAGNNEDQSGMGTTIVSMLICKGWFVIGNVGDSRCYRFRDGQLSQISEDHSWIKGMVAKGSIKKEHAKRHPQRGLLLQAMGNREIEPTFTTGCPIVGDIFVLCSDGLTEVVSNNTIGFVLNQNGSPQKTAEKLIQLANENGGPDNISVIVVKILPPRQSAATISASNMTSLDNKT